MVPDDTVLKNTVPKTVSGVKKTRKVWHLHGMCAPCYHTEAFSPARPRVKRYVFSVKDKICTYEIHISGKVT